MDDITTYLRVDADKSLARPTSPCRRTESTVSLELEVSSYVELQVFSCYRGWKEACQATRAILTTSKSELSISYFPTRKAPKGIHAILTETLGEHAPSYAAVKNWVDQFKHGDFPACGAPRPFRTKSLTTPEIIHQINELILEDRRISSKWIAEQLGISRERFGSFIYEVLDMRNFPKSESRNAWTPIKNVKGASRLSKFEFFSGRSKWFHVVRDWWPWTKPGYITMTQRQSNNQWSVGIEAHPAPQNSECKNPMGKFSPSFLGVKMASSSCIIFQRAKLWTRSITHLCRCNWRRFWRKKAAGCSSRESCSCKKMPRLTGHLQPRINWPTWASSVLITHPILRIWPRRTTTCFLDW